MVAAILITPYDSNMKSKESKTGRGGARPGAGRKPAALKFVNVATNTANRPRPASASDLVIDIDPHNDPMAFLMALMNDNDADVRTRADAAKALLPFTHQKLGEAGKKANQADLAKDAATGKFAASQPPKLVARNG